MSDVKASPIPAISRREIFGTLLTVLPRADFREEIANRIRSGGSGVACFCTVHMLTESHRSLSYQQTLNGFEFVLPDGMPVLWLLRSHGDHRLERTYGPDETLHFCEQAALEGWPIALYGSAPATLDKLEANLKAKFPGLKIPVKHSPPFRPEIATPEEDAFFFARLKQEGVRLVFIGLGCPKQEKWAEQALRHHSALYFAVGAAFDFHAGVLPQAPRWMMRSGLEWLFRLSTNPRKMFWRYLTSNSLFFWLLLRDKFSGGGPVK